MLVQKDVTVQNHVTETCENFILVGHMFLDMQICFDKNHWPDFNLKKVRFCMRFEHMYIQ